MMQRVKCAKCGRQVIVSDDGHCPECQAELNRLNREKGDTVPVGKQGLSEHEPTGCPSHDLFLQYRDGGLSGGARQRFERHLRQCEACRHELKDLTAPPRPPQSPEPSSVRHRFGRYEIVRPLGKGGMGDVVLARDTKLDRLVALKIPLASGEENPQILERFYREARAAATLNHPNLCSVFDVGEIDGAHYLTMEYVRGKPLNSFLSRTHQPTRRQTLILVRKLALALDQSLNRPLFSGASMVVASLMLQIVYMMPPGFILWAEKRRAQLLQEL